MDRETIDELLAYTDYSWARHARVMEGLSDEQFTTPIPGSGWPAPREAFMHVVGAYDGWLNSRWGLSGAGEAEYEERQKMTSWEEMADYRAKTRTDFRRALEVDDETLFGKRERESPFGVAILSPADVLTNLLMHERGHHGDISTLFYQMGVKGYIVDWIAFAALPDEFIPDVVEEGEG